MEDKSVQYVKDCNDLFDHFEKLAKLKNEPTNYYIMKGNNSISYGTIISDGDKGHLSCFKVYPAKDNTIKFIKEHFASSMDNIIIQNQDEFGTLSAIKINNIVITVVDKDLQKRIAQQMKGDRTVEDVLGSIMDIASKIAGSYFDLNDFDSPKK